jgi:hypothetical protein
MQSIEILPVALCEGAIVSLCPGHAESFVVGWPQGARPEEVAADMVRAIGMQPVVLHSTSWRYAGNEVILTYLAVVAPDYKLTQLWSAQPVTRAELARGGSTTPPESIGVQQVLEHALRHLAWLLREDPAIQATLPEWAPCLSSYTPEPFQALNAPFQAGQAL